MKLTLQIQLLPTEPEASRLRETMERFNEAAIWIAGKLFERKLVNKILAQKLVYYEVRERFKLSAQMTILCIHRVCEAYKRDKTKQPVFRKHAAVTYDGAVLNFRGIDRVSIWTLDGRMILPYVMGKYQAERFTLHKGQTDLVLRKDGKWFLLVTVDVPDGTPIPVKDFIGIDFGIVNLAVDSKGEIHSGSQVELVRLKQHRNRKRLQKRGTRGAKKRLKRLSGKESRFRRHVNHVISKQIVAKAKGTRKGIALEDLKGIKDQFEKRFRRQQRSRFGSWACAQLRSFVEYKAKLAGIPVVIIDPRNTSRTCSKCGYCDKANRKTQDRFKCLQCGYSTNADLNAARNIRARAISNLAPKLTVYDPGLEPQGRSVGKSSATAVG